jgi:hypothetical protein
VDRFATVALLLIFGAFLVNVLRGQALDWLRAKLLGRSAPQQAGP